MPTEADVLSWKAILSASAKLGNVMIIEKAALRAIELNPNDSSSYVMLSNTYAKAGKWDDVTVTKVRLMMKQKGVRRIFECNSIVIDGKVHQFLVAKEMDAGYGSNVHSKIDELV
ncbi:hypothetical protein LWI28_017802 [Acer negundo]|uniref:Pentatricopeptide repeat-containing protein n=1 Tax=Acer negundo TaxID=4023 RepID=A0AAD5P103_ACENE|nr:hypothetical protein LWI28_017802 [Acer negundo]